MKLRFAKYRFIFYSYGNEKECKIKDNTLIKDNVEYKFKKINKINYLFLKFFPFLVLFFFTLNKFDLPITKNKLIEYLFAILITIGLVFFDDIKRKIYIYCVLAISLICNLFLLSHPNLVAYTIKYSIVFIIIFWFILSIKNNCYFIYEDDKIVSHFITNKEIK